MYAAVHQVLVAMVGAVVAGGLYALLYEPEMLWGGVLAGGLALPSVIAHVVLWQYSRSRRLALFGYLAGAFAVTLLFLPAALGYGEPMAREIAFWFLGAFGVALVAAVIAVSLITRSPADRVPAPGQPSRRKFERALNKVKDTAPEAHDRLTADD